MPEEKRSLKVFLSHAHSDAAAVRILYDRLTADGVDAWLDKEKLLPGQDWELEIRKAVREADVIVVCLSKKFNQAGYRQKEVRWALDAAMEQPEGEIFIIPARLEECDNLESLQKWHWVDLFQETGYEILFRSLRARADKIGAMFKFENVIPSKPNSVRLDILEYLVGRYQILEEIGMGGMTTVYKAHDSLLDRTVSIKVIRTEHIPPSILERSFVRFKREAKVLAHLNHPNIATILDYGEQDGMPYLVMEYLSGGTLKQVMVKPMPWREAIELLLPISQALDYIHSQNILHRDLKPSNILFSQNRQPILTDFGISMVLNLGRTDEFMVAGSVMGTPEYMAPEQFTGKPVDSRADIYALGIIFYEAITGQKPFTADTPMAVFIKQVSDPLPNPQMFVPNLPHQVEKVLRKALEKDPANRYTDMAAFTIAMQELLDGVVA